MTNVSSIFSYVELMKPRLGAMVLVMAGLGFFLGSSGAFAWVALFYALLGTGLVASGGLVLNNYLERDVDALMERTKYRPIPQGSISPQAALAFGVLLVLGGCSVLIAEANILASFLALLSCFLYVVVYTPMKRLSWWNTSVGAIPGALPPMIGWAAATGRVEVEAWILFALLYIWQHPHFYAIAWLFRDDYARGGLKMLPVVDPTGRRAFHHSVFFLVLLIPVSLLPTLVGMAGWVYFWSAGVMGLIFLGTGIVLARSASTTAARRVLRASLIYLPLLLLFIVIDATF